MTRPPHRATLARRSVLRPCAAAAAAVALAAALAACGGSQAEAFKPTRALALGDELSFIDAGGRKYTINSLKTDGSLDCAANPMWMQDVAGSFGLVFPECNPNAVTTTSRIVAAPGAKVADLTTQIDGLVAAGGFTTKDLVTVLVGMHDVLEQYALYPATPEADLVKELEARGKLLGAQLNRLSSLGAPVLASTLPDLGKTPFAIAQEAANPGRADLLTRLSHALDNGMRLEMVNDGRKIGLLFADIEVQNDVKYTGSLGFSNVTQAACLSTSPVPNCTTATLQSGATATNWLWADQLLPSAGFHYRMGRLARDRAHNNPF